MKRTPIIAKHELAEDWAKSAYIPQSGELVVFEYYDAPPRIKIGDGKTNVNQLPFYDFQTGASV